jgi:ubiquinone/menaquinone biosynthesis C-methylase UbiE
MLKQFTRRIEYYSVPRPLLDYFIPLIGDKKEVKIADIGSGPFSTTGQLLEGVKVEVYPSDQQGDFDYFWKKYSATPTFKTEYQNMEKLTYPDEFFDIVNCVNALDHTVDALSALKEMIRVCKVGGWVYIDCALNQHTVRRHRHFWDAKEDGTFINETGKFSLKDFGFSVEYHDIETEKAYNHIIAKLQKCSQ